MIFIGKRLIAAAIDFFIVLIPILIPTFYLAEIDLGFHYIWLYLWFLLVFIGYGFLFERKYSQTLGKKVMELKVVCSKTGDINISIRQLLIRNIFRPFDYIAGWGLIPIILFKRRLGEFVSQTEVRENSKVEPSEEAFIKNEKAEKR